MTTEETALPTIPNDEILKLLTSFNVRYMRKVNFTYQCWEFSHSQSVSFLPEHTPDQRRAIIRKVSDLVRISVLQDIASTLPEIEATVGQPDVVAQFKRSVGL